MLILNSWKRSGLPANDFAPLVGVSGHTLYAWKARFEADGPAGLMDKVCGRQKGSRLSEVTKRAIIMLKEANPEWGVERISAVLERGPALGASPGAISTVLKEWGYELREEPTRPHPDKVRRFERATTNQVWQTDLFTFVLKRQNQRYLVAFLDDHSRFVVSYGLHASQPVSIVGVGSPPRRHRVVRRAGRGAHRQQSTTSCRSKTSRLPAPWPRNSTLAIPSQ